MKWCWCFEFSWLSTWDAKLFLVCYGFLGIYLMIKSAQYDARARQEVNL